jgi:hypothetical protein
MKRIIVKHYTNDLKPQHKSLYVQVTFKCVKRTKFDAKTLDKFTTFLDSERRF